MIALLVAAALPFAPPLDRPIGYAVTEWRSRGTTWIVAATLDETVTFAAEPGGYAMTIRTTGYRSPLPATERAALDAAMAPMVSTAIRLHLSAGGVPERVVDGAASWAAMLASLRAQVARFAHGDPAAVPATRMLAALSDTPPAERDARLLAAADDMLGAHLPLLAIGESAVSDGATIVRLPDDDASHFRETRASPGTPTLETIAEIAIDRRTGLVARSVRRTSIVGTIPPRLVRESETRQRP